MKAPERVETSRLRLRRPVPEDAEAVFSRYAGDPDVTLFLHSVFPNLHPDEPCDVACYARLL